MADHLIESGFVVTYLHAESAKKPTLDCTKIDFNTFSDLDQKILAVISENKFDLIIHAAAVSDYSVLPTAGKINSDQEYITLQLKKNPKLIEKIKKLSPSSELVGFKLTSTSDQFLIKSKIDNLFEKSGCDYVIHNDWSSVRTGQTVFNMYSKQTTSKNLDLQDLAIEMAQILLKKDLL